MKNIIFMFLIIILNLSLLFSDDWHYYAFWDQYPTVSSICIDSNDNPHILYDPDTETGRLIYVVWNGYKWVYDNIEGIGSFGYWVSMALDKNNSPHISFYEYNNGYLMYAYKNSNEWNIDIVDNNYEAGEFSCIALDSKGYPHIAYSHYIEGSPDRCELKYAYWDGSKWNIQLVDDSYIRQGNNCSIALDSYDYPHISYEKEDYGKYYLGYAHWDGSKWIKEILDLKDSQLDTSICIDSNNYPHIAYASKGYLCYMRWNGSEWIKEQPYHCQIMISMKLDKNDYPHIAFRTIYNSKRLVMYASWDGSKWNIEVAYNSSLNSHYCSLALDSKGNPHISCDDDHTYSIYYIWYGNNLAIDLTSFSAKPNNDAITLNWSISTDEDISGFNLYRRVDSPTLYTLPTVGEIATFPLQTDDNTQWTRVNTSLITGTNPYSFTDRDITPETNYEYKLEAVVSDRQETLGTTECTSGKGTPGSFDIVRIYPTPANDRTSIDVVIPEEADIDIAIYDISGRRVRTIASGQYNEGEYTLSSYITGLTNGVYIVRMTANGFSSSKNFVVAK